MNDQDDAIGNDGGVTTPVITGNGTFRRSPGSRSLQGFGALWVSNGCHRESATPVGIMNEGGVRPAQQNMMKW